MYELLLELRERLDQIAIVGLGYISEDFRLKKLEEKLKALSSKAPVLAKLYDLVVKLLEGKEVETYYIELNSLVDAILKTQGSSKPKGEEETLTLYPLQTKCTLTFMQLQEIRKLLAGVADAKWASLKKGYKEGKLIDNRLLGAFLDNIGDSYEYVDDYYELPEEERKPFSMSTILEQYGKAIVPIILERFEGYKPAGKVNAIKMVFHLGKSDYNAYYKRWAESEEAEAVVATALSALGALEENKEFLFEFKTKKKKLQEARLLALAEILHQKGKEVSGVLTWDEYVLSGKEMAEIREYCLKNEDFFAKVNEKVCLYNDEEFMNLLVEKAQKLDKEVETLGTPKYGSKNYQFLKQAVYLLDHYKVETALETVEKLMALNKEKGELCFEARIDSYLLVDYLIKSRYPECRLFLAGLQDQYNGYYLTESFVTAINCYDPKNVYNEFIDLVTNKYPKVTLTIIEMLERFQDGDEEVLACRGEKKISKTLGELLGHQYMTINGNRRMGIKLEKITWDLRWLNFAKEYPSNRLMTFFLLKCAEEKKRKNYKDYYVKHRLKWDNQYGNEEVERYLELSSSERSDYEEELRYLVLGLLLTGAKEEAILCIQYVFVYHSPEKFVPMFSKWLEKEDLGLLDRFEKRLRNFEEQELQEINNFINEIKKNVSEQC